ncbi:MAG: endospore germination permease [Peptococcaceae bacterium]|jgi:spore germination protein KB|nr:endospore germination permease [Peptococcaceae bacterium]
MQLEKGKLSYAQLTALITGYISSQVLALGLISVYAGPNAWLAVLTGMMVSFFFAWVYVTLARQFPGKTLVEFNDILYGPYLGKGISALYLLFFFQLTSYNMRDYGEFFGHILMTQTPVAVFVIVSVLLAAIAVRYGIETIGRVGIILVGSIILYYVTVFLLLLKEMDWSNLLPFFSIPVKDFYTASTIAATVPFGEAVAFLMIIPFYNQRRPLKGLVMKAFGLAGCLLVVSALRNSLVLGNTGSIAAFSFVESVRLIHIADFLTRLDILVAMFFSFAAFIKGAVLFYVVVLGISQLLRLRSYKPLTFPLAILFVCVSMSIYDYFPENFSMIEYRAPYYNFVIAFLLPLASLILAKAKQRRQAGRENH